ncbi:MAG: hypothetical protein SFT90_00780 [Rickettsiales bacterium]|nr:hypothetical protein [Rickettsiales bacterium]
MISYRDWNPRLDNGDKTLEEVRKTLPANSPEDISQIVKLFENPKSPFALKGAVNLERHDCIHIVLGRGLLPQDEAFVIGFTMGTSKNIKKYEEFIFKTASMFLYPKKYRFSRRHMKAYDLGLEYGKKSKVEKIYEFPFEKYNKVKLSEIRNKIGINIDELKKIYRREQEILPNTKSSLRLDVG